MPKPKLPKHNEPSIEPDGYLHGLYDEFHRQVHRYMGLTHDLMGMEAKVELAEKTLCLTRDHFADTVSRVDSATPQDWKKTFASVRFVGYRLADACIQLLREHKRMTTQQLRDSLNAGMFRFRTNTPLREIHAALLRQQHAERHGDAWVWTGPKGTETRLQVVLGELARAHTQIKRERKQEQEG